MSPMQHVDELRQLVEAGLAQEGAEPACGAGRPCAAQTGAGLLLGVDAHAAELEHLERLGRSARSAPGDRRPARGWSA